MWYEREKYYSNLPATFALNDFLSINYSASAVLGYNVSDPHPTTLYPHGGPTTIEVHINGVLVGSHESGSATYVGGTVP